MTTVSNRDLRQMVRVRALFDACKRKEAIEWLEEERGIMTCQ